MWPGRLAAALGPIHPCRRAGPRGHPGLSRLGRGLCLGEIQGLGPESGGTVCKQR